MKKIFSIVAVALCVVFCSNVAKSITRAEQEAQTAVRNYFNSRGWETKIDKSDNSVNFYRDDILYWVTFQEKENGVLYTLHRKPIKMDSEDKGLEQRRIENSIIAANLMNKSNPFKTVVTGAKVEFVFPILAATPQDFTEVFPSVYATMKNVKRDFDNNFKSARMVTDSIHNFWRNNDTTLMVIPQKSVQIANNNVISLTMQKNVDFRILDEAGEVITPYGQSIRLGNLQFIQAQIAVSAKKKGIYTIGMDIYMPNGKKLVPFSDAYYTTETTVEVNTKPTVVDLESFGASDGSFWQLGEYKVVFYDGNNEIGSTTFHVI